MRRLSVGQALVELDALALQPGSFGLRCLQAAFQPINIYLLQWQNRALSQHAAAR